jgi:hypothetical protein
MGYALLIVGGLASLYATIKILIHAFKSAGIMHAIFCFLCGFYALYWLFAKYDESDKKTLIILVVVGIVLSVIGNGMVAPSAIQAAA